MSPWYLLASEEADDSSVVGSRRSLANEKNFNWWLERLQLSRPVKWMEKDPQKIFYGSVEMLNMIVITGLKSPEAEFEVKC